MQKVTGQAIKEAILAQMENPEPARTILNALKPFEGKRLNKRIIAAVQDKLPDYRVYTSERMGWCSLVAYKDNKETRLTLAHQEKNVVVDTAFILEENRRDYSALDERNQERERLMKDEVNLYCVAEAINHYNNAADALKNVLDSFGQTGVTTDFISKHNF